VGAREDYEGRKQAARAEQDKQKWWFNKSDPMARLTGWLVAFTGLLALATIGTIWVLKKTDDTLRAGQRAFVFVKRESNSWAVATQNGADINRQFYLTWENNGNTQTRDLKVALFCPRPNVFDTTDPITANAAPVVQAPRLLGPKQSVWGGVCNYSDSELEYARARSVPIFVAARATYRDIFDEWHVTEYCIKMVRLVGDFKNIGTVPANDLEICAAHNCADDECSNQ
jgi:hypothetical protein